jgi:hypothetical protein
MPDVFSQGYPNPATALVNPRAIFRNSMKRNMKANVALTVANIIGDRIFIGKIQSSAIVLPGSLITHAALGGTVTLNVGFNEAPGAAVNCLGALLAVSTGGTKSGMAAVTIPNMARRLWELAGLAADPGREMELIATIAGSAVATPGNIDFSFEFAEDR